MSTTNDYLETEGHTPSSESAPAEHASFEVGENQVPWFLWVFFILILLWAAISWIPLFGY